MMKRINYITFLIALSLGLINLAPAFVAAQTGAAVNTSAAVTAPGTTVNATAAASVKLTAAQATAVKRADAEIDRRTKALTDLNARVQTMQKVTDSFKAGISASITNEVNILNTLKAKIDADTDGATLKIDVQSITGSYRVFALVLPQGRIAAAADREVTLVSMMSTLGSKLQARIQTAATAGASTTAMTAALTDMAAKLQDAQAKAEASVTASSSLTPDAGDKTKMASNDAALKQARADLKAAQADLVAARKDVDTIVKGLAKISATANASSTTQVSH
jgi:hypothetical protein